MQTDAVPAPPADRVLSAALWAANLQPPVPSLSHWLAGVETRLAQAQAAGMQLLMLPELACVQWLNFAPPDLPVTRQPAWLGEMARQALPPLQALASRYGVALLPGTLPWPLEDKPGDCYNRAWLLLPDGRALAQDKLFLTPSEQNPDGWRFTPGTQVQIMEWDGLRLAIMICLDVEATGLWARLATEDLDLVLVPAKTDGLSGFYRVFGCARARAIELSTVVCAVGAVGTAFGQPATDTVVGGASVFLPCDTQLNLTGIGPALEPQPAAAGTDPVLHIPTLPLGYCRRLRHGAAEAEAWAGSWPVDHIKFQ